MAFDSKALSLGPGKLYIAPLGTAEPTDLTTAWVAAWTELGYTEEGSEFSYEVSSDPVEVAESLDPLMYRTTARSASLTVSLAENTVRNLIVAFNGGTVTVTGTGASEVLKYEAPEPGKEVRKMIGFQSEDGTERWVYRQVFQSGSTSLSRSKDDKTVLPLEFRLEKPTGKTPWVALYGGVRSGGATATV